MMGNLDIFRSNKKKNKNLNKGKDRDKTKDLDQSGNDKSIEISTSDIDGVDIASYGKKHNLSLSEIKQKIKNRELISRSERGEIYIYDESDSGFARDEEEYSDEEGLCIELKDVSVSLVDESTDRMYIDQIQVDTNNLKKEETGSSLNLKQDDSKINSIGTEKESITTSTEQNNNTNQFSTVAKDKKENINVETQKTVSATTIKEPQIQAEVQTQVQPQIQSRDFSLPSVSNIEPDSTMGYLAILAENLKISKQEQVELLKLTQESIKRVVDSTEKLVASKEALIEEKDKIIESLQSKIDEFSSVKYKLLQENEDLKTLVEALELSNKR